MAFDTSKRLLVCAVMLLILSAIGTSTRALSTVEVTGVAKCTDSPQNTVQGTSVRIVCKLPHGETRTVGETELKAEGKFSVSLRGEMLQEDGKQLKGECFAVLHQTHCPSRTGLESSHKLVFESKTVENKHIFVPVGGEIRYSTRTCSSHSRLLISSLESVVAGLKELGTGKSVEGLTKKSIDDEDIKKALDALDKVDKLNKNSQDNSIADQTTMTCSTKSGQCVTLTINDNTKQIVSIKPVSYPLNAFTKRQCSVQCGMSP